MPTRSCSGSACPWARRAQSCWISTAASIEDDGDAKTGELPVAERLHHPSAEPRHDRGRLGEVRATEGVGPAPSRSRRSRAVEPHDVGEHHRGRGSAPPVPSTGPDCPMGERRRNRYVLGVTSPRYRCTACGNLTRFDVTTTTRDAGVPPLLRRRGARASRRRRCCRSRSTRCCAAGAARARPWRLSHPLRRVVAMATDLRISCDECVMEGTSACDDCVVTFLCGREPGRRRHDRRRRGPGAAPAGAGRARAGAAPPPPHRMTRRAARSVPEPRQALRAAGTAAGLDVVEVATAEPFVEVRRDARASARRRACTAGWRSPTASRRAPPTPSVALRRRAALVVGARSYLVDRRRDAPRTAPRRAGRPLRVGRPLRPPQGRAQGRGRGAARPHGWRARVLADDNALVDRAAAHRAGHRLVGQERQPAAARARAAGTCSGSVVTDAPLAASAEPGRGPLRLVHPLPRRLPHRRHHRARASSTPAAACPGCSRPRGRSRVEHRVGPRRPHLRLRRLPGGVPAEPAGPDRGRRPARERAVGAAARRCSTPTTTSCSRAPAAGTSPGARSATCAATPSSCSATSATAATPTSSTLLDALPRATPTRCCAATPSGRRGASDARICSPPLDQRRRPAGAAPSCAAPAPMTHLFVTNDFPPKIGGIQTMLWELWRRLDPATFAVLTTPHAGRRGVGRRAAVPGRAHRASRCCCPRRSLARRIDALADEIGADLVVLDPALPGRARSGPRLRRPTASCSTAPRSPCPGRLPGPEPRCSATCCAARRWSIAAGGYPLAEAERAAGRAAAERGRAARGRHRALPSRSTPTSGPRRGPGSACRSTGRLVVSLSRLVPRKGMDVLIEAAALLAPDRPDLTVAIGGGGRDRGRLDRLVASTGAPGAAPRPGRPTTTSPRSTAAPTSSPCSAATGGPGSSRRASASCSSRRPPPGCPRWRATAGARPRRWSTARPGSWSTDPTTRRGGRGARPAARRPRRAAPAWATAGRARAVAELLLRRPGRRAWATRSPTWEAAAAWLTRRRRAVEPGAGLVNSTFVGTGAARGHERRRRPLRPDTLRRRATPRSSVVPVRRSGTGALLWAYALGVSRSRTELVDIAGLFFLAGDVAPRRRAARAAASRSAVQVVAVVVAASDPALHRGRLRGPRPDVRPRPDGPVGRPSRPASRRDRRDAPGVTAEPSTDPPVSCRRVGPECADGRPGDRDDGDRGAGRADPRRPPRLRRLPHLGQRPQGRHGRARDDEGRGQRGDLPGRGHGPQHQLHAPLRPRRRRPALGWELVRGDIMRQLDGSYVLEPGRRRRAAPSSPTTSPSTWSCRCPGFVKRRAEPKIIHTALRELRAHVEQLTP